MDGFVLSDGYIYPAVHRPFAVKNTKVHILIIPNIEHSIPSG